MTATFDTREAAFRQADRLFASASRTRPASRPGAEPGEPMTIIAKDGWYLSFGPADIQAVIGEMETGAPCGICRRQRCVQGAES